MNLFRQVRVGMTERFTVRGQRRAAWALQGGTNSVSGQDLFDLFGARRSPRMVVGIVSRLFPLAFGPVATFSPPGAVLRCRASSVAFRWLFSAAKHSGHKVERKLVKLRCFERRTSLGGCTSANAQQPTGGVDPGDLSRRTRSVLEADTSHETQMPIARAKSASAR